MATKRMFDKAIVETDAFLDLSMPAKALYFLLGMEADDEGFVSPKRVMRIYGGNEDDLRILIAKRFVISFQSGVVVITDWQKNNWLDSRRLKKTEYRNEREQLGLDNGKYVLLSDCLADAKPEEYRGVERSREEREAPRIEPPKKKIQKPEASIAYLRNIPEADIEEFILVFRTGKQGIDQKAKSLLDYCEAKGKTYKNYKAFLRNALRKDFGERTPDEIEQQKRTTEALKRFHAQNPALQEQVSVSVEGVSEQERKTNLSRLEEMKKASGIGKNFKM